MSTYIEGEEDDDSKQGSGGKENKTETEKDVKTLDNGC